MGELLTKPCLRSTSICSTVRPIVIEFHPKLCESILIYRTLNLRGLIQAFISRPQ